MQSPGSHWMCLISYSYCSAWKELYQHYHATAKLFQSTNKIIPYQYFLESFFWQMVTKVLHDGKLLMSSRSVCLFLGKLKTLNIINMKSLKCKVPGMHVPTKHVHLAGIFENHVTISKHLWVCLALFLLHNKKTVASLFSPTPTLTPFPSSLSFLWFSGWLGS